MQTVQAVRTRHKACSCWDACQKKGDLLYRSASGRKKKNVLFLDKAKQLALGLDDGVIQPSFNLPLGLQSYIASVDDYQLLDADELPAINFASKSIGNFVKSLASKFVGCIISFGHITFYVTSGDAFIHNHALLDDCSTGITMADYHTKPTAVIKQKQFMNNTKFYELSIFYGFFEFLVVGCIYHDKRDGVVRGCLGSSLQDWKEEATMSSALVYAPTPNREWVPSPRLLRGYLRMDFHRLWGFHLANEYISGFTLGYHVSTQSMNAILAKRRQQQKYSSRAI